MPLPFALSTDQIHLVERDVCPVSRRDCASDADLRYFSTFLPSDQWRMNIGCYHYDRGAGGCIYDAARSRLSPILDLGTRNTQSAHHDPSLGSSGRKRAVCIGINRVQGDDFIELHGSVSDANNIRDFLMRQGYTAGSIRMLTDDTEKKPTKSNIIEAMSWLVQSAKPGDRLFLHYSGHGDCVPDQNGDEIDGKDEDIICYDSCPFIDDGANKARIINESAGKPAMESPVAPSTLSH
ncbi:caspase domain-containing protein [Armillaria luteobubalina]|uniref:Caspase domain-containing protein n=1 Tax=Armillaria luteobubalina TaxID=153913 RepID=A0AA39QP06_9AGAR|nr:caspase domain-containing protein [Armillaria luteobubalina]